MKTFSILMLLLLSLLIACSDDDPKEGTEGGDCRKNLTCEYFLSCNLENGECEPCNVDTPIEISCEEGICTVPQGNFCMGCQDGRDNIRCDESETPYHKVFLNPFEIDQNEVTVAEFKECIAAGSCNEVGHLTLGSPLNPLCNYNSDDRTTYPMNCVNWHGANEYCKWKKRRLPYEAEWEKAARGVDGRAFPWGTIDDDPIFISCDYAVIDPDPNSDEDQSGCGINNSWLSGVLTIGQSPYGLNDMSGNMMEWVTDYYDIDYYRSEPEPNLEASHSVIKNPHGPRDGGSKVLRGGSWKNSGYDAYTFRRTRYRPEFGTDSYGFRCVRSLPLVEAK